MYDNISFIIAIASSVGLISSEILPFIPIEGNGILHSIFFYLSKLNNLKSLEKEKSNEKEKEKIIEKNDNDIVYNCIIFDNTISYIYLYSFYQRKFYRFHQTTRDIRNDQYNL